MFCKSIGGSIQQNFGGKACYNRDMQFKWLRHLKCPAALTAILAIAISAAMLIGRAQPLPERIALLHLGDKCELPCWIGITPGTTTFQQARALVLSVFNAENGYIVIDRDSLFDIKSTRQTQWDLEVHMVYGQQISPKIYDSLITYIGLNCTADMRLGDFVNRVGVPTQAGVFYTNQGTVYQRMFRQSGTLYTQIILPEGKVNKPFDMARATYGLSMWDESIGKVLPDNIRRWHGFGIYQTLEVLP